MKRLKITEEQAAIVATDFDIKVNAIAGSGKTTTLLHYAGTRDLNKTLLYLVFNKSAKEEADNKFRKAGLRNVTVQTAHSLAYQKIMVLPTYTLCHKGHTTWDILVLLKITGDDKFLLANHINKLVNAYCNSDIESIDDFDYLSNVGANKDATGFINKHIAFISKGAKKVWNMMKEAEIEVTHSFYLKMYQLSKPQLKYDYILFDEGQDASPVMLNIFMNQKCIKVIVGDTHQQIYKWRGAVNSLECVDFPSYPLTKSFRFGKNIAALARNILKDKNVDVEIDGIADYANPNINSEAYISRTNICLLQEMISFTNKNPHEEIFFEGNINSLIYTDEGVSIYDIINLFNFDFGRIRNKFIKSFKNFSKLMKYTRQADDRELYVMCKLAEEYNNRLGLILKNIKAQCVTDRDDAVISFTTTHKAKGLEYDKVYLTEDFCTIDPESNNKTEETNILYVAATRAKKEVILPPELAGLYPDKLKKKSSMPSADIVNIMIDPDENHNFGDYDKHLEDYENERFNFNN